MNFIRILSLKERISSLIYYYSFKIGILPKRHSKLAAVIFSRFFWENKEWQNIGSGRMQKELMQCLNELGYTTSFAGHEDGFYTKEIWKADIIITLATGLYKLPRKLRGITCLYTCNTHVVVKNQRLLKSSKKWGLIPENTADENIFLEAYERADYLLIAENDAGINNFLSQGISKEKIFRYNNAVDNDIWVPNNQKQKKITFVCWASELGLRKGLPVLIEAWKKWYNGQDAELFIVGMPTKSTAYYFGDLKQGEASPGLFVHLEIFPTWHKPLVEFIGSCHVAVFPTLEDAQPSSLLEMTSCGLPVITTHESGVDFDEDFCYYVNLNDADSLKDGFEYWYFRKESLNEYGKIAREFIIKNHSWGYFRETMKGNILQIMNSQ
jgi:glycosyltransferase involved in cell wall biosynthesis